jgi:hypothetical protein
MELRLGPRYCFLPLLRLEALVARMLSGASCRAYRAYLGRIGNGVWELLRTTWCRRSDPGMFAASRNRPLSTTSHKFLTLPAHIYDPVSAAVLIWICLFCYLQSTSLIQ